MKKIYVCSQYGSRGDMRTNIENAKAYTMSVINEGAIPICPHLYLHDVLDDKDEAQRDVGMRIGLMLLEDCDELRVFSRVSDGMRQEIKLAKMLDIPVRIGDITKVATNRAAAIEMEGQIAKDLLEEIG